MFKVQHVPIQFLEFKSNVQDLSSEYMGIKTGVSELKGMCETYPMSSPERGCMELVQNSIHFNNVTKTMQLFDG